MAAKRKRRKKKRYHTGTYVSTKTGQHCKYRSGWELLYLTYLDNDASVQSFEYEQLKIPYVSNVRTGKIRHYFPDVYVKYTNGESALVEIKPKRRLEQVKVKKKLDAARVWCGEHGVTFKIVTEVELKGLGLL